jgi:hypothetical protein
MKAQFFVAITLAVQLVSPLAAFSDDDSKWASGRDSFQDFCDGVGKSMANMANMATGSGSAAGNEEWGSRRGGWDSLFSTGSKKSGHDIVTVEGHKKVTESKNVVIKAADGSRTSRRYGMNAGNYNAAANLKKYIDGGSSSYTGSMPGAGSSRYYPIGSGLRGGGGRSSGGWGTMNSSSSSTVYGFGNTANSAPRPMGVWGNSGSGAGNGSALVTGRRGF